MKSYRKIFHLILLYVTGFVLSIAAYVIYANHYINPRLSKDIDKMLFAKYSFLDTDGSLINVKSAYDGKIRLIDFWTLNCSFCTDDLDKFYTLDLKQNQDFLIIAVNSDAFDNWNEYLIKNNLIDKHPQIIHFNLSDERVLKELEVEFYPTYFLLDEEGLIRSRCSYNFVLSRINRVLTNKAYFKDYLHDINKYFPCGGLGRPSIAYSIIIFPILLLAYYYFYYRKMKGSVSH